MTTAFVAFKISEDEDVREYKINALREKFEPLGINCVESGKAFEDYFADAGGWDGFIEKVACGTDYYTRAPLFHMAICTDLTFGRATGQIITKMLEQGKTVLYADVDSSEYLQVAEVLHHDHDDWQSGYSLRMSI